MSRSDGPKSSQKNEMNRIETKHTPTLCGWVWSLTRESAADCDSASQPSSSGSLALAADVPVEFGDFLDFLDFATRSRSALGGARRAELELSISANLSLSLCHCDSQASQQAVAAAAAAALSECLSPISATHTVSSSSF